MHFTRTLPLLAFVAASAAQYLDYDHLEQRSLFNSDDYLDDLVARSDNLYYGDDLAASLDSFFKKREASIAATHDEIFDQLMRRAVFVGGSPPGDPQSPRHYSNPANMHDVSHELMTHKQDQASRKIENILAGKGDKTPTPIRKGFTYPDTPQIAGQKRKRV